MKLINFGHPLTAEAQDALTTLVGSFETRTVRVSLDFSRSFEEQLKEVMMAVGLTPDQWQTEGLVIQLPSVTLFAALVVAEIAGRSGQLPRVINLVRGADGTFSLGGVISLQQVKESARTTR